MRFEVNEPVIVTQLASGRPHAVGGMIRDISSRGMLIKLPHFIDRNALVRVETNSMLLLAEVVRIEPEGEDFLVAIMIRHSLHDLKDLENLNRALLGRKQEGQREPEPVPLPIMRV
jgi:hypothetical protein